MSYLRKRQTFGSLQQAPQRTHFPFLFFETGSTDVKVLFIFVRQVFLFSSAIGSEAFVSSSTVRIGPICQTVREYTFTERLRQVVFSRRKI